MNNKLNLTSVLTTNSYNDILNSKGQAENRKSLAEL